MEVGSRVRNLNNDDVGRVATLYATTAAVDWEDGSRTRVSRSTIEVYGRQPKPRPSDVEPVELIGLTRRFNSVVNERMRALGMTYDQLAEVSGISRRTLLRLEEHDDPSAPGPAAQIVEKLALALRVEPGAFWELR